MDTIINLAMKWSGVAKVLEKINGCKTYIGAAAQILTGSATILAAVANLLSETAPLHSAADYYHWAQTLSHDPNMALIAGGAAVVGHGLTAAGLRHAQEKAVAEVTKTEAPKP